MIACDKGGSCYLDYGKPAGMGIPDKINVSIIDTDFKNWAIMIACKSRRNLRAKNEHIWILSREPTLSSLHYGEAKNAIDKVFKRFNFDRLVSISQDADKCNI